MRRSRPTAPVGEGTGSPHLPSQGSVLAADGRVLVVARERRRLRLRDRAGWTGAPRPRTCGFVAAECRCTRRSRVRGRHRRAHRSPPERRRRLAPIEGSERQLSASKGEGAQVSFTPSGDASSHRAGNRRDLDLRRGGRWTPGRPDRASVFRRDPVRLDFRADGILVVTEAFGGQVGAAAASSYRLKGSLRRSARL